MSLLLDCRAKTDLTLGNKLPIYLCRLSDTGKCGTASKHCGDWGNAGKDVLLKRMLQHMQKLTDRILFQTCAEDPPEFSDDEEKLQTVLSKAFASKALTLAEIKNLPNDYTRASKFLIDSSAIRQQSVGKAARKFDLTRTSRRSKGVFVYVGLAKLRCLDVGRMLPGCLLYNVELKSHLLNLLIEKWHVVSLQSFGCFASTLNDLSLQSASEFFGHAANQNQMLLESHCDRKFCFTFLMSSHFVAVICSCSVEKGSSSSNSSNSRDPIRSLAAVFCVEDPLDAKNFVPLSPDAVTTWIKVVCGTEWNTTDEEETFGFDNKMIEQIWGELNYATVVPKGNETVLRIGAGSSSYVFHVKHIRGGGKEVALKIPRSGRRADLENEVAVGELLEAERSTSWPRKEWQPTYYSNPDNCTLAALEMPLHTPYDNDPDQPESWDTVVDQLKDMHTLIKYCHCDIAVENLYLNRDKTTVMLGDLGHACKCGQTHPIPRSDWTRPSLRIAFEGLNDDELEMISLNPMISDNLITTVGENKGEAAAASSAPTSGATTTNTTIVVTPHDDILQLLSMVMLRRSGWKRPEVEEMSEYVETLLFNWKQYDADFTWLLELLNKKRGIDYVEVKNWIQIIYATEQ